MGHVETGTGKEVLHAVPTPTPVYKHQFTFVSLVYFTWHCSEASEGYNNLMIQNTDKSNIT